MRALLTILFTLLTTIVFADSAGCPKYDRKSYRHWIDEDRDCQNACHEVLIEESLSTLGSSLQKAAEWSQEAGMTRILAEPLPMRPSWILIAWCP
ncbi:MAG: hypothetical protein VXY74_12380 [SAR324 cluster bacterium]|nr:hypothetical protein [SAR324 cluster bacterium]